MFQSSGFRFHRFEDTPNTSNAFSSQSFRSINQSQPLYNSYINMPNQNSTFGLSSSKYQFDSSEPFPFKEIISLNFLKILTVGNNKAMIEKYLPKMLYQKFKSSSNPNLALLMTSFQQLLNYLFSLQEKVNVANKQMEDILNKPNSELNREKNEIEKKIELSKQEILNNSIKIKTLQNKIKLCKTVLYSTGNQNLIPNDFAPLDIHDDNGIFYCEICPNRKFLTYEKVHAHYVKHHLNLDKMRYQSQRNFNFEKYYFDSKLSYIKDELKSTILNLFSEKKDDFDSKKLEDLKEHFSNLIKMQTDSTALNQMSQSNPHNKSSSQLIRSYSNNNEQVNVLLKTIQSKQDEQYQKLQSEFEDFKNEILNHLLNISQGKKIVIQNPTLVRKNYVTKEQNRKYQMTIEDKTKLPQKKGKPNVSTDPNQQSKALKAFRSENDISFDHSENNKDDNEINVNNKEEYEKEFKDGQRIEIKSNFNNDASVHHHPIIKSDNQSSGFPSAMNNSIKIEELPLTSKTIDELKQKFYARDRNILFNVDDYETTEQTANHYNFIPVKVSKKDIKKVTTLSERIANSYDFTLENHGKRLDKEYYANIIRKMFIKMDEKSEKNRKYAEYKDNVYSLNEIEKSLKDFKDMNNILYKDIQPDKVFDFIGYSRKDNEFI